MNKEEKAAANQVRMTVSEAEPVIRKVEMLDQGRGGLKVTYGTMEKRNGVMNEVEYTKKQYRPVQNELRKYFDLCKEHLLKCTGYIWSSDTAFEMLKGTTTPTYILLKGESFMVGGKRTVLGDYITAINSPLVKTEDYEDWNELGEIMGKIKQETIMFMKGVKGADSRQVVIDYMITNKGQTPSTVESEFDNMTEEERRHMMTEAFEEFGLEIMSEGQLEAQDVTYEDVSHKAMAADINSTPAPFPMDLEDEGDSIDEPKERLQVVMDADTTDVSEDDFANMPGLQQAPMDMEEDEAPVGRKGKRV